jgi:hypothetical protein
VHSRDALELCQKACASLLIQCRTGVYVAVAGLTVVRGRCTGGAHLGLDMQIDCFLYWRVQSPGQDETTSMFGYLFSTSHLN